MTMTQHNNVVLISRTDNIGDVILTLPLVGKLKEADPTIKLILLARNYVKALAQSTHLIDEWIDWDELKKLPESDIIERFKQTGAHTVIHAFPHPDIVRLAYFAKIPRRVSYFNKRLMRHLRYCNKLILFGSKRRSRYHEAERNLKLLKKINIQVKYNNLTELIPHLTLTPQAPLAPVIQTYLHPQKFNLILHPGSNGHAEEWPVAHFLALYHQLPKEKFHIIFTGTLQEREKFYEPLLKHCPLAIDTMGKLSLSELISFIAKCDGLLAASTGPLHLAASLGIHCLGIFVSRRQIGPRCWRPIGLKAEYLLPEKKCLPCETKNPKQCECTRLIFPHHVKKKILAWLPE